MRRFQWLIANFQINSLQYHKDTSNEPKLNTPKDY
jgi:hypothetical protein